VKAKEKVGRKNPLQVSREGGKSHRALGTIKSDKTSLHAGCEGPLFDEGASGRYHGIIHVLPGEGKGKMVSLLSTKEEREEYDQGKKRKYWQSKAS